MTAITDIFAREIMDSRGIQLWKLMLPLKQGPPDVLHVPSGASTGAHEAVELRDGQADRFGGKGVHQACENVNGEIFETLSGLMPKIRSILITPCWFWTALTTRAGWALMPFWV